MHRPLGRIERSAHRAMRVMKTRSGRAFRDAKGFGDLGRRQPEVMAKNEDGALVGWQATETAIELIAVRH